MPPYFKEGYLKSSTQKTACVGSLKADRHEMIDKLSYQTTSPAMSQAWDDILRRIQSKKNKSTARMYA
jgi:hypothetical protein